MEVMHSESRASSAWISKTPLPIGECDNEFNASIEAYVIVFTVQIVVYLVPRTPPTFKLQNSFRVWIWQLTDTRVMEKSAKWCVFYGDFDHSLDCYHRYCVYHIWCADTSTCLYRMQEHQAPVRKCISTDILLALWIVIITALGLLSHGVNPCTSSQLGLCAVDWQEVTAAGGHDMYMDSDILSLTHVKKMKEYHNGHCRWRGYHISNCRRLATYEDDLGYKDIPETCQSWSHALFAQSTAQFDTGTHLAQ